jgi:hypothetical protein
MNSIKRLLVLYLCITAILSSKTNDETNKHEEINLEDGVKLSMDYLEGTYNNIIDLSSSYWSSLSGYLTEKADSIKKSVNEVSASASRSPNANEGEIDVLDQMKKSYDSLADTTGDLLSSATDYIGEKSGQVNDYLTSTVSGYTENPEYNNIYSVEETIRFLNKTKTLASTLIEVDYVEVYEASLSKLSSYSHQAAAGILEQVKQFDFNKAIVQTEAFKNLFGLISGFAIDQTNLTGDRVKTIATTVANFITQHFGENLTINFSFVGVDPRHFMEGLLEGVSKVPMAENNCYLELSKVYSNGPFGLLESVYNSTSDVFSLISKVEEMKNLLGVNNHCKLAQLGYEIITPIGYWKASYRVVTNMNELYSLIKGLNTTDGRIIGNSVGKIFGLVFNYHTS